MRREILAGDEYLGLGYKLLVEILARNRERSVAEIPYRFVDRQAGQSKLDLKEIWAFLRLLTLLMRVRFLPKRS